MNNLDKQDFWNTINVCCELYRMAPLSKDAVIVWFNKLQRFNLIDVRNALNKWTNDNKRMPTPADIIELCKAQEQRVFNVALPRRYTDDERQANRDRLAEVRKELGWKQ